MRDYFQSAFADPDLLDKIKSQLSNGLSDDTIREKVASIIDQRLDQLTPQMVKEIVQTMIHKHLGWLVVWGCVRWSHRFCRFHFADGLDTADPRYFLSYKFSS